MIPIPNALMRNWRHAAIVLVTAAALCHAQAPPADRAAATQSAPQPGGYQPHNLNGMWELRDLPGYGDYARIKSDAQLTPEGKAETEAVMKRVMSEIAPGEVAWKPARYCFPLGMPFMMGQSPPLNIVQSPFEIQIFNEEGASPRHIYIDGRTHPADLEPTTNGHSIGHWEGDTLVVDTIGFNEIGILPIPGGGTRGKRSHLVEHMKLIDNGSKLRVEATWDDPKLYAKPNTFTVTHFRMPLGERPMEGDCDASSSLQGTSTATPVQK